MDIITSLQNDRVKLTNALQSRARTRRKERKIVLEGARLVGDAVERGNRPLFILYEPDSADPDLIHILGMENTTLIPVSPEVMAHVSDTATPQGVVAVFPLPIPRFPRDPRKVLILDKVRDPGNMGTLLRTAAASGVQVVILSPGCADPYNPKVLRSGMGAHFRVPIVESGWTEIKLYCDVLNVYVTAGDAEQPYDAVDWTQPWAVIVGSEAHGVGEEAEAIALQRIVIPMAAETESLNAAMAAGIVLFEAARQQRVSKS